jgi:hypothetical protein
MSETLYRRNQDGMMETVVPQAQGKAAALSSYLAQGGTPFKHSGRFKKGPMKGKNVDEATAEFERMWATSPDSLKQKYANRTSGKTTDLAPSERMGTPAPRTNDQINRDNTRSRILQQGGAYGTPGEQALKEYDARTAAKPTPPPAKAPVTTAEASRAAVEQSQSTTKSDGSYESRQQAMKEERGQESASIMASVTDNSFAELTKAPVIPAGGVNSVGDGVFVGGVASQDNGMLAPNEWDSPVTSGIKSVSRGVVGAIAGIPSKMTTPQPGEKNFVSPSANAPTTAPADMKRADEARVAAMRVAPTTPTVSPTPAAPAAANPARPPTAAEGNKSPEFLKSNAEYGKIADQRMAPGGPAAPAPPARPNRPADDFTAGPDKEQVGVVQGRPTYAPKVAAITATPQQAAGAQRVMESTGMTPMQPRTMATPAPARSTVAGVRQNDPDIIRKDNVAAANYQSSFTGGNPSDAQFDSAKNGQKALYDNASSQDQAKLVANSLRRSSALPTTVNAPRATVVPGVQPARPSFARR